MPIVPPSPFGRSGPEAGSGLNRFDAGQASPEVLALLRQLVGAMSGPAQMGPAGLPFRFEMLEQLDSRVDAALRRAEEVEGLAARTVASYRAVYRLFRRHMEKTEGVARFLSGEMAHQRSVLEDWIASLRANGANHTSVNTYVRYLHAALSRVAREQGFVDPTRLVPTPPPGRSLPRFLTRAQLTDVFHFVRNHQWSGGAFERDRNVALLATMALGGCRLGETLSLVVEDVSCEAGLLRIRKGKGQRGGKPRVVCMPTGLTEAIARYLASRGKREHVTDNLFVSTRGDCAIGQVTVRRLCALLTRRTGIKVAPHLLRHTAATLLRQAGVSDRLSMEQLGHASLAMLQRYSHVSPGERQQAVARLDLPVARDAADCPLSADPNAGIRDVLPVAAPVDEPATGQ